MLLPYRQVFRIRGLSLPLLASFAGSLPIGMLNLSVLLLVCLHGQSFGAAGIVVGALNLGSGAGLVAQGAWIDRRGQWPLPLHARLVAALLTLAASCAVLGAAGGDVAAVAVGMVVFGAAEAVTGITLTALIQHVAPHGARTESYAIIISAALAGTAAGNLAAGALAGGASVCQRVLVIQVGERPDLAGRSRRRGQRAPTRSASSLSLPFPWS